MARLACAGVLGALLISGCVGDNDVGGCPLAGLDAVGEPCRQEGLECGETSLCDPCTSDLSECEALACEGGQWVERDVSTECTES